MKKILLIIFVFCSMAAYTQEIVISEEVKEMRKKYLDYYELKNLAEKDANIADSVINVLETFMKTGSENFAKRYLYRDLADLLAQYEYYDKAVNYYDLAFKCKQMKDEDFQSKYRKKYFAKDSLLYQRKCAEYLERSATQYTATEMKIIIQLKEMLGADQAARNYYSTFPSEQKITENNLIIYVDTINKRKIIEIMQKYPEIENPLSLDWVAHFLFGRHLFTA